MGPGDNRIISPIIKLIKFPMLRKAEITAKILTAFLLFPYTHTKIIIKQTNKG